MAVLVAVVVGYFAYRAQANLPGTQMPDQGNLHIQSVDTPHVPYNSDPPTSGPHLPYIAPWGIHTRPIERELQVHNLEDGGVVVQYNCECPEIVAKLKMIGTDAASLIDMDRELGARTAAPEPPAATT